MFKRLKVWIRRKLTTFLGLDRTNWLIEQHRKSIEELTGQINANTRDINAFFKNMEGGMDLGVRECHKNWAVVAVQGNGQDYIKFIDLSNMDYRECMDTVKYLERRGVEHSRLKYDAPIGIKPMFYDYLGRK